MSATCQQPEPRLASDAPVRQILDILSSVILPFFFESIQEALFLNPSSLFPFFLHPIHDRSRFLTIFTQYPRHSDLNFAPASVTFKFVDQGSYKMTPADRGKQISASPPHGSPYSVTLPNTEQPGRTAIYRHWRFRDGLLKSLDPNVSQVCLRVIERSSDRLGTIDQYGP